MIEQQDISAEARAFMRALYGKAKEWPLYDIKDKQVMVLDEFNIHPEKEPERKIVDWERTYFLTKYYVN